MATKGKNGGEGEEVGYKCKTREKIWKVSPVTCMKDKQEMGPVRQDRKSHDLTNEVNSLDMRKSYESHTLKHRDLPCPFLLINASSDYIYIFWLELIEYNHLHNTFMLKAILSVRDFCVF